MILVGCGFGAEFDGGIETSVVCGFDGAIDGDINWWLRWRDNIDLDGFGRPCSDDGIDVDIISLVVRSFEARSMARLIESGVRGFDGGSGGDINLLWLRRRERW